MPGLWSVDHRADSLGLGLARKRSEQSAPHAQEGLQSTLAFSTESVKAPHRPFPALGFEWCASLAEAGLGGQAEKDRRREQASGRREMQKPRQRWTQKGTEKPREVKARKRGERGKDREQGRKEARRGKEGERRKCTGRPDREGLLRPLWFPSLFSALLLLAQGFLPDLLGVHQGLLASGKWQLPHLSSGQKVTSIQHIGQSQLLAQVEKVCPGYVALW